MYLINIMFGEPRQLKRFRFVPIEDANVTDFDKAVKELNEIYKERGRFSSQAEIISHFYKYGFERCAL